MERHERLGRRAHVTSALVDAHFAWCASRAGPSGLPRALTLLAPEAAEALVDRSGGWVPFWVLVATDRAIAAVVGGDPARVFHELGRHSALTNWTAPYRAFEHDEPHRFFERTALWHDGFQDFGRAGYEKVGLHAGHFTIEGCEEYSPVFCASALGYFEGALSMMGAQGPFSGEETLCQCAGDPACVFAMHW